ncbi:syncoilin-like [Megalops cyprinoides]|uniref:syncoilin-like n=1 Tax=Megalops cyprinoides TaxID=118141 RepID=UPI0018645C7A|nr:syncoilin-like [Megalops cyprinoides]
MMESMEAAEELQVEEEVQCEGEAMEELEIRIEANCTMGVENLLEGCEEEMGVHIEGRLKEVVCQVEGRINQVVSQIEGCMGDVGCQFEECIEEVGRLESRRDELVAELLQLEQPMVQAAQALRAELSEARRQLSLAELERQGLREEARLVKRKLFIAARDCIQSQVTLATQQHEVAQFAITQEELQAQILELTQEAVSLKEAQHNRLSALQDQLQAVGRRRTRSDLSHCRRASLDLERYLQGGMRALEDWYEPRLLALLKRKQFGEEALRRTRDQARDLKAQLAPLQEEVQRLLFQGACLEERIALMEREREENVVQHRETFDMLEESLRDLKTEIQVQKKKNEELDTIKSNVSKEVDAHRQLLEEYGILCSPVEKSLET